MKCDMYGRNLVFRYGGHPIRYVRDAEELTQSGDKAIVINVQYEEFPNL